SKLSSLKDLEQRSDQQLSKASSLAHFYNSLRQTPTSTAGAHSHLFQTCSSSLPNMIQCDRVSLYLISPPIPLTSDDSSSDASFNPSDPSFPPAASPAHIHPSTTLHTRSGPSDLTSAPFLSGGVVAECAQSSTTMNIAAGSSVDLARTNRLRATLRASTADASFANATFQTFAEQDNGAPGGEDAAQFAVGMLCVPVLNASSTLVLGVLQAMGPRSSSSSSPASGPPSSSAFDKDAVACGEGVARELGVILENVASKEKATSVSRVSDILEHLWPVSVLPPASAP
ncbi:hypothetical protein TeGR_g8787, partial [Tetraparma gracilis]